MKTLRKMNKNQMIKNYLKLMVLRIKKVKATMKMLLLKNSNKCSNMNKIIIVLALALLILSGCTSSETTTILDGVMKNSDSIEKEICLKLT